MTTIVLPYPPSANRYWRLFKGRVIKSTQAREYQNAVGWQVLAERIPMLDTPVQVQVTVKLFRPHKGRDLDNCLKVLLDALQGYAYQNDNQIARLVVDRCDDKANPRVEITVEEVLV